MRVIWLALVVAVRLILMSVAAEAQPVTKVWRIGYLTPSEFPPAPLIETLRQLGYVEGQTAKLEIRGAKNDLGRLEELAADLVRAQGPAFAAMSQAKVDAVLVPSFPGFYFEHLSIIEAAAQQRIPAIYEWGDIARAGGLLAYGILQ